jgi:hypothetical protein
VESPDIVILKAQLQTIREYDQKLLDSVHWSQGIVGGVALLLVGFSWFTNSRIYERDKAALTQELEGKLQSQLSLIRTELEVNQKSATKEILEKTTAPLSALQKNFENKIQNVVNGQSQLDKRITSLNLWSDYNREQAEAYYWEWRTIKGNELARYLMMLNIAIQLDAEHHISKCLAIIEKIMGAGCLPYWGEVTPITATLDKLPSKFSALTNAIKEHLKKVKA